MGFEDIPVWIICAGTIGMVALAVEAGYRVGKVMHRRSDEEKETPVSAIASAILGLAAFMLAFTFGFAADRYQSKRALVREEAGVIRTAWQRADFLPAAERTEALALLRKYVEARVNFAESGVLDQEGLQLLLKEAQQIQRRLWGMAVANARKDMNSDVAALYIESLNEMNRIHANRVSVAVHARVPTVIWLLLYCITFLGMLSVGYQTGIANSRRSLAWAILALAFAMVFSLIAALDRPSSGVLKVTQQPLIDVRDAMDAAAQSG